MAKLGEATVMVRLLLDKSEIARLSNQIARLAPSRLNPNLARSSTRTALSSRNSQTQIEARRQAKDTTKTETNTRQLAANSKVANKILGDLKGQFLKFASVGGAIAGLSAAINVIASGQRQSRNNILDLVGKTSGYAGTYRSFEGKNYTKAGQAKFVRFNQVLENNGINTSETAESVNQFYNWLTTTDDKELNTDLRLAKQQILGGTLGTTEAYERLLSNWLQDDKLRNSLPDQALGGTDITKRYRALSERGQKDLIAVLNGQGYDPDKVNALVDSSQNVNNKITDNQAKYNEALRNAVVKDQKIIFNNLDAQLKNRLKNIEALEKLPDIDLLLTNFASSLIDATIKVNKLFGDGKPDKSFTPEKVKETLSNSFFSGFFGVPAFIGR